jgi:protein tyrosine phosphatase
MVKSKSVKKSVSKTRKRNSLMKGGYNGSNSERDRIQNILDQEIFHFTRNKEYINAIEYFGITKSEEDKSTIIQIYKNILKKIKTWGEKTPEDAHIGYTAFGLNEESKLGYIFEYWFKSSDEEKRNVLRLYEEINEILDFLNAYCKSNPVLNNSNSKQNSNLIQRSMPPGRRKLANSRRHILNSNKTPLMTGPTGTSRTNNPPPLPPPRQQKPSINTTQFQQNRGPTGPTGPTGTIQFINIPQQLPPLPPLQKLTIPPYIINTPYPDYNIKHIWFTKWPDHGIPIASSKFPYFIRTIINDMNINKGGSVIHCSAGVGRSGVVYVILSLILDDNWPLKFDDDWPLDPDLPQNPSNPNNIWPRGFTNNLDKINKIIEKIQIVRTERSTLVQTSIQFKYICDYFGINDKALISFGVEQYDKLLVIPRPGDLVKINCKNRNRYGNIIPYEDNRIILRGNNINSNNKRRKSCDNYINASRMSKIKNNEFIITQGPLPNTAEHFCKMLAENNIKRIIMVTTLMEEEKIKCYDYFNSTEEPARQIIQPWGEIRNLLLSDNNTQLITNDTLINSNV